MDHERAHYVSMSDVQRLLCEINETYGTRAALLTDLAYDKAGRPHLRVRVAQCDSAGVPVSVLPYHAYPWPIQTFKTWSALAHFILERTEASLFFTLEELGKRRA